MPNGKGKGINPLPYNCLSIKALFQKLLFQLILIFVDFTSCQSVIQDIQCCEVASTSLMPVLVWIPVHQ